MAAVVGYLVAAGVAILVTWRAAGMTYRVLPDSSFPFATAAGRQVTIAAGLAGFAVTGVVLIVTQRANAVAAGETSLTTLLAMFTVAYLAYFTTSVLFANVSEVGDGDGKAFDLGAAQYAGSMVSLYFATFIGWLALRPLFETFELHAMAKLVGWLLAGALVVGYGLLASALYSSGYTTARLTVTMPIAAVGVSVAYEVVLTTFAPELRSVESTLRLTVVAFFLGGAALLVMTVLPILADRPSLQPVLARRGHLAVLAYAEGVMVLLAFLLLAIFGLS